jgi:signal transduction histidine kinase/DNA-binding NarL/FixJ family response regulator
MEQVAQMIDIWITIGILLYLCIYHMFVFMGRRKDLSNLAYSLLCLMYIFIALVVRVYPTTPFFDDYYYNVLILWSALFIAAFSIFFAHTIFDLKKIRLYSLIFISIEGCCGLVFCPLYVITHNIMFIRVLFIIMLLFVVPFIIMTVVSIIVKKQYRDRKRRIVMFGFMVLALHGMLVVAWRGIFSQQPPYMISTIAILLTALIFSYALTDSFNREHKDLLELKENLERKVRERTAKLKKVHKQKTDFFINLAHETKTPVTLISNYLDAYIRKKGISPETRVIKRNIEKLLRDIVNILDMEKLETGITFYNQNQTLDLSDIIKQKVMLFTEPAGKKNISITAKFEDNVAVRIDPYAADRILNNLIDNSLKYTRPGGSVEVRLKSKTLEDKVEIIVKDTGIGIPKQKLKHIFDPFYQISHKKKNYQGLGLGLSIVKMIADEIGAKLSANSKAGSGTEFVISLPRYVPLKDETVLKRVKLSSPLDTSTDAGLPPAEHKEGRYNVLVVEDNPEMLAFLQNNIGRKYNVHGAVDGRQAWEILENMQRPQIILSDIMMDVMDGYEFYKNITAHKRYKSIPFIFLTAKTSMYQQLKGLRNGAVDFITKPFSIDVLMAKIDSIIKNQELQKEAILNQIGMDLYRFLSAKGNVALAGNTEGSTGDSRDEKTRDTRQSVSRPYTWHKKQSTYVKSNVLSKLETDYGISKREMEVIRLIKEGFLYKEIAAELDISLNTVETYRKRIFKKCNVQNKIELFRIFSEQ